MPPKCGTQGQFIKIKARQREQDTAWMDEQRRRDGDRLEQAIRFLRSRGYIVAPDRNPQLWFCGRRRELEAADLCDLADRLGCPFERSIRETREDEKPERRDGRRRGTGNGSRAVGR
jgi:hypothetical protein